MRKARSLSARLSCKNACNCGKVSALGIANGTIGNRMLALVSSDPLLLLTRGGNNVQYAASTRAFVGYNGTVVAENDAAAKEAIVGVLGEEGDSLEEDTASKCVGKSLLSGGFEDGITGTSKNGGRCDLGSELMIDMNDSALRIL